MLHSLWNLLKRTWEAILLANDRVVFEGRRHPYHRTLCGCPFTGCGGTLIQCPCSCSKCCGTCVGTTPRLAAFRDSQQEA